MSITEGKSQRRLGSVVLLTVAVMYPVGKMSPAISTHRFKRCCGPSGLACSFVFLVICPVLSHSSSIKLSTAPVKSQMCSTSRILWDDKKLPTASPVSDKPCIAFLDVRTRLQISFVIPPPWTDVNGLIDSADPVFPTRKRAPVLISHNWRVCFLFVFCSFLRISYIFSLIHLACCIMHSAHPWPGDTWWINDNLNGTRPVETSC